MQVGGVKDQRDEALRSLTPNVNNMVDEESDWISREAAIELVEATLHCYRERAINLVREAVDGLKVKSRTAPGPPGWVSSHLPDGSEIIFVDRNIEVWREDVLKLCSESQPLPAKPPSNPPPRRARAAEEGILLAIRSIWPDGIPQEGLKAKDRDNRIANWLKEHGRSAPTDVAKAVQRALKAHPEVWEAAR
jgi:hypothetical protein